MIHQFNKIHDFVDVTVFIWDEQQQFGEILIISMFFDAKLILDMNLNPSESTTIYFPFKSGRIDEFLWFRVYRFVLTVLSSILWIFQCLNPNYARDLVKLWFLM